MGQFKGDSWKKTCKIWAEQRAALSMERGKEIKSKAPAGLVYAFTSILDEDVIADNQYRTDRLRLDAHFTNKNRAQRRRLTPDCIVRCLWGAEKSHKVGTRGNPRVRGRECMSERDDDGHSTGEICSYHKGKIEECLGGNSTILLSQSPPPLALFSHFLSFPCSLAQPAFVLLHQSPILSLLFLQCVLAETAVQQAFNVQGFSPLVLQEVQRMEHRYYILLWFSENSHYIPAQEVTGSYGLYSVHWRG